MLPPQTCFPIVTVIVTVGPTLFQVLYNNSVFVENSSFISNLTAVNITYLLMCTMSIVFLVLAATTEPGIIPRQADPLSEMLENVPYAYK